MKKIHWDHVHRHYQTEEDIVVPMYEVLSQSEIKDIKLTLNMANSIAAHQRSYRCSCCSVSLTLCEIWNDLTLANVRIHNGKPAGYSTEAERIKLEFTGCKYSQSP